MNITKTVFLQRLIVWCLFLAAPAWGAQYIPDSSIPPSLLRSADLIPTGEANAVCVSNTGTPAPSITLCSTLALTGKTVLFKLPEYTVAALPASHPLAIVTDASTSSSCTVGGGSNRVLCHWNGSAWASLGGGGGGVGDPGGNGLAVRTALNTLIARTLSGTTGKIVITNGDGVAGNPTVNVGADVAIQNAANTFSALNTFSDRLVVPLKGSATVNGEIFVDGELVKFRSNTGVTYSLFGSGTTANTLSAPHYCADAGSSDTYACNLSPVITSLTPGGHYWFKANSVNTGQATLNLNSIGNVLIKKMAGGITTDLDDADIRIGQIVEVVYDGTNFQMISQLGNALGGLAALTEDSNSVNSSKSVEIGDVSTNSWEITGSNVTGHKTYDLPNVAAAKLGVTTGTLTDNNCPKFSSGAMVDSGSPCGTLSGFSINIDNSAGIADADDRPKAVRIPFNQTVNKVCATTDSGTTVLNVQRNDGSAVDMLSSNLTAAATEACTNTFVSGENVLTEGNYINVVIVTGAASGTPKQLTISFNTTRN